MKSETFKDDFVKLVKWALEEPGRFDVDEKTAETYRSIFP